MNSPVENIFKDIFNDTPPFFVIVDGTDIRKVICNSEVIWGKQTVTYHIDINNIVTMDCLLFKSILTPELDLTHDTYGFLGWRLDDTASEEILHEFDLTEKDVHVYAVWQKPVILSYDANGGTVTPSSQYGVAYYNNGNLLPATITLADAPTRKYYDFNGWSLNSINGTLYGERTDIEITEDSIMYANWTFHPVVYTSPTLTLVSSNLSGSNATSNNCYVNENKIIFSMNAGYGNYTANAITNEYLNLEEATKVVINYSCGSGDTDGNYDYDTYKFQIGTFSVSADNVGKTQGSATIDISGLTSEQLSITSVWHVNSNYATQRGSSVSITSIEIS